MTKRTPNFPGILTWHPPAASTNEAFRTAGDDEKPLDEAEIDAIVTLAHLMVTADDAVSDDESDVFFALTAHLTAGDATRTKHLGALVAKLDDEPRDPKSVEARARHAASTLRRPLAKALAYKAAYTVRIWDLEANPDEDDLDDIIVEALGLGDDEAKELAQQVNEAMIIG